MVHHPCTKRAGRAITGEARFKEICKQSKEKKGVYFEEQMAIIAADQACSSLFIGISRPQQELCAQLRLNVMAWTLAREATELGTMAPLWGSMPPAKLETMKFISGSEVGGPMSSA